MSQLRDLFHKPPTREIAGHNFMVYQVALENFDDAFVLGNWFDTLDAAPDGIDEKSHFLAKLEQMKTGSPERAALENLVAALLKFADLPPATDASQVSVEPLQLTAADARAMPATMLAEAAGVIMDENAAFFLQRLQTLQTMWRRLTSIGSELPSSLSARGTTPAA